jgi:hypothetical protein
MPTRFAAEPTLLNSDETATPLPGTGNAPVKRVDVL